MRFPEIDQYIANFKELIRRAGYTIGSEETISFFLNSLTPSILDAIIAPPFPENYNEYKAKAVHTAYQSSTNGRSYKGQMRDPKQSTPEYVQPATKQFPTA
jgi:hypothetical protein